VASELSTDRRPKIVAMVSLEHFHGYQPERYVGAVLATGATVFEAVDALEQRALHLARENYDRHVAGSDGEAVEYAYVLLGLRFASSITASGQPEWVAYGTLARGRRT
jgi:gamma-glutamylcyclotransferase (GGCT)/AIG2-like uncharacterized protein YtfP